MTQTLTDTLAERGARYGSFAQHAEICTALRMIMRHDPMQPHDTNAPVYRDGWLRLQPDQAQALDTIMDKIARILNGDPDYDDNWRDIAGYATLVLNRLMEEQNAEK